MRVRLAIVGFGRLGRACAHAILAAPDLELVGVVRRPGAQPRLPAPLERVALAHHLRDLEPVDAALLCIPSAVATGMARELLQLRTALVECAQPIATRYGPTNDARRGGRATVHVRRY